MKKPFVTAEQLEDIAARYPTPFHLYDAQGIRENARRLKAAFSWNPGYRESSRFCRRRAAAATARRSRS